MNARPFYRSGLAALTALLTFGLGFEASAQSVTTTPVGAVTLTALANSDTHFSIPLVRPSVFEGVVGGKSANVITLTGAAFTTDILKYQAGVQSNTYYIQMTSGSAVGHFSKVVSNSASSVTCEYETDITDSIQLGDKVVIRPYWTLGTVFPDSAAGTYFVPSTSNLTSGRRTEILIPDFTSDGINKSPNVTYFYNTFWRRVGNVTVNQNDVIIPPDTFFIIRGNSYAESTKTVITGVVNLSVNTVSIMGSSLGRNDNPVGIIAPTPLAFGSLNLIESGAFIASTSNLSSGRGDELLVYDNSQVAKNKAPSATYYYNSFWRKVGDASVNQNTANLPEGAALVIRKKQAIASHVVDWPQPAIILN